MSARRARERNLAARAATRAERALRERLAFDGEQGSVIPEARWAERVRDRGGFHDVRLVEAMRQTASTPILTRPAPRVASPALRIPCAESIFDVVKRERERVAV